MGSLKENAYDLIKERILDGTYIADDIIDEKELAQELHASRTPVREALIALAQEGFINILPKRGVFVAPFSYHDILSVFQTRELLEPWLIKTYGPTLTAEEIRTERGLAIRETEYDRENRITIPDISIKHHPHGLLLEKCENRYIRDMLGLMEEQVRRVPSGARKNPSMADDLDRYLDRQLKSHLELLELMERGEFDAAAREMAEHVRAGKQDYIAYWFGQM